MKLFIYKVMKSVFIRIPFFSRFACKLKWKRIEPHEKQLCIVRTRAGKNLEFYVYRLAKERGIKWTRKKCNNMHWCAMCNLHAAIQLMATERKWSTGNWNVGYVRSIEM